MPTHTDDLRASSRKTLQADIAFLVEGLRDIIRVKEGESFLKLVQKIRILSEEIREGASARKVLKLQGMIASLPIPALHKVARAFTIYFQLVNIAEERERVRRILDYERDPAHPQQMSLGELFQRLKDRGIDPARIRSFMEKMSVELVMTAHPTEAKRRTVLEHLLGIAQILSEHSSPELTAPGRDAVFARLREALGILWQTSELRRRSVHVADEVDHTLFFFRRTILDLPLRVHEKALWEFKRVFGDSNISLKPFVRFGSWVGADRDGNPFVTPEVSLKTADAQEKLILNHYLHSVENFIRKYSQSSRLAGVSKELIRSTDKDQARLPELARGLARYETDEIYRKKFSFMHGKLENRLKGSGFAYANSQALIDDLEIIIRSLKQNKAGLAAAELQRFIRQVRVFGFHLASLDYRDHSHKFIRCAAEIFKGREIQLDFLAGKIARCSVKISLDRLSPESRDVLEQLDSIRRIQDAMGVEAVEEYILSHTTTPEEVLAFLYLAKKRGLIEVKSGKVVRSRIEVVPLFETIASLESAHEVMARLWQLDLYRSYAASRGDIQEIMLGYSDSSKDGGYLTANWKLHQAQSRLSDAARRYGIQLEFFHGKGGSIDRGGGESFRAILAQPFAAPDGRIKITEQGEVVSQKYSNPVIARRNIEQLTSAVLWSNLVRKEEYAGESRLAEWEEHLKCLSEASLKCYRNLLFETPGFLKYFFEATPIRVLERARIGSRPTFRGKSEDWSKLRAIPWVFSWIQSRYIISAWYGMGHALETFQKQYGARGLRNLRQMYNDWPFFQQLIQNVHVSLAKADLRIAKQYSDLVSDKALRNRIHGVIAEEHERTVREVLRISSESRLLSQNRVLEESIRLRNPYVDPLHYIQVRLLKEWPSLAPQSPKRQAIEEVLLLTVNGIAFGMKSTG